MLNVGPIWGWGRAGAGEGGGWVAGNLATILYQRCGRHAVAQGNVPDSGHGKPRRRDGRTMDGSTRAARARIDAGSDLEPDAASIVAA